MNWRGWKIVLWFKSRATLVRRLNHAYGLIISINETLKHNMSALENTQQETYQILGAIALQHGGEFTLKDEFLKMMQNNESPVKVQTERNKEDTATIISVVELKKEENASM